MELYTLDAGFRRDELIEVNEFISVIWTERYGTFGDVALVTDPTPDRIALLKEGTFLQKNGSQEVMLIETALIEDGVLKVTGNTLDYFLRTRLFNLSPLWTDKQVLLGDADGVGYVMAQVVELSCMPGSAITANNDLKFDGPKQIITNLTLGDQDDTDHDPVYVPLAVTVGPVYDALVEIAARYSLGFSLYLEFATEADYSLKFKTYRGLDRTSTQLVNPVVRFTPIMDSLTNLKELRSISGYRNVAYAYGQGMAGTPPLDPGVAFADADADASLNFQRRVMQVWTDKLTDETTNEDGAIILAQAAKDALANNNYIKMVDGEIVPQSEFQYGTHYGLGDIVELQGASGILTKARVTEYIQTQDSTGERAYPTITVLD